MTPLIQTPEDVARLREVALSWIDTPYAPNGCVKGAGVACHQLPSEILQEFGFQGDRAPDRGATPRAHIADLMIDWLQARPDQFVGVDEELRPGDVIVTAIPFGHLALALDLGEVVHCWQHAGVHLTQFQPHALRHRIRGIFRPLAPKK